MPIPPEFREWLKAQIEEVKEMFTTVNQDGDAFAMWAMHYINEMSLDDAFNRTDTLEGGDAGIDGWNYDPSEGVFLLQQAKYTTEPNKMYDASPFEEVLCGAKLLMATDNLENTRLEAVRAKYQDARSDGASIVLQCVIAGEFTENAINRITQLNQSEGNANNSEFTIDLIGLSRIYELWQSRESDDQLEGQTIEFPLYENNALHIASGDLGPGIEGALLCNLSGNDLGRIVSTHSPNIFDANVRYHLGNRNKVNSKIREQLKTVEKRKDFWCYNNGLTIVCQNFQKQNGIVEIENPQIVNGCQTAVAIEDMRANFDEQISFPVAAKIISVTESDEGRQKQLYIAERTNSQSSVKISDLKSNTPQQQHLQVLFRNKGWFYERKRGEWNTNRRANRDTFGSKKFTMEEIGQSWWAFSGSPSQSVNNLNHLFTDDSTYREVYSAHRHLDSYILAYRLFNTFNDLVNRQNANIRTQIGLGEFKDDESGLLNKILRAKKLWVAHMVALAKVYLENVENLEDHQTLAALTDKLDTTPSSFHATVCKTCVWAFENWCNNTLQDGDLRAALKQNDENTFRELKEEMSRESQRAAQYGSGFESPLA